MMRILNAALAVALALWAWKQSTDPDTLVWAVAFGVTAFWNALAAIRVQILTLRPITMLMSLTMAAALLMIAYFWPDRPGWWQPAMWGHPAVRNGTNAIAFALSLVAAIAATIRASQHRREEEREAKERALERKRRLSLEHGALAEDI